jgi:hypothetical protein
LARGVFFYTHPRNAPEKTVPDPEDPLKRSTPMSESKQIPQPPRPAKRGSSRLERLISETLAIAAESARIAG